MKKKDINDLDRDELIEHIRQLDGKLKKRNRELFDTRQKLRVTKSKLKKMKDIVLFQRQRILTLHP